MSCGSVSASLLLFQSCYLILSPATGESSRDLKTGFEEQPLHRTSCTIGMGLQQDIHYLVLPRSVRTTDLSGVYKCSEDQEWVTACCFGKAADLTHL